MPLDIIDSLVKALSADPTAFVPALQNMLHNKVNINRLQKDMEKAQSNIDALKDQARSLEAHNGK